MRTARFSITHRAAKELERQLVDAGASADECPRVQLCRQGVVLSLGKPRENEHVFKVDDREVLVADDSTCRACAGMCLDLGPDNHLVFVFADTRNRWAEAKNSLA